MASRPLETLSVIDVPLANGADPVLPTETLMPAGLETTRSPLRPVAVTVSVTVCAGGVTASGVVRVAPPYDPVIVTPVEAATAWVVIVNVALVLPAATVTLAGTAATPVLLLESVTTAPPVGAAAVSVAVPCDEPPPTTLVGLTDSEASDAVAAGGVTVSDAVRVAPPYDPVIVTPVEAATAWVVIVNVALVPPAATVTLTGTAATPVLLLESVTTAPPVGAAAVSVAVPCDEPPPTTLVGLTDSEARAGADATACGVKLRTEEKELVVPAALTARTRHQCWRLASVPAVNCDAVTVWLTTNGAEKVLELSTWRLYDAAPVTSFQSRVTGCAGVAPLAGLRSDGAARRVTVSTADRVTPPRAAVIVTVVEDVTDRVVTVNTVLLEPAATVTLAGTVATFVLLLESVTAAPPVGAGPLRVTVPCVDTPPVTLAGLRASDAGVAEPVGEPVFTVSVAKRLVP